MRVHPKVASCFLVLLVGLPWVLLLAAANPDRAAIDKKLVEISAVQLARRKSEVDYRLRISDALTSEQRQKLQQIREDFRHRGPEGRGPGGPEGHTPALRRQGE